MDSAANQQLEDENTENAPFDDRLLMKWLEGRPAALQIQWVHKFWSMTLLI